LEQLTARLAAIASRVQTPLALAGIIMVVLYAISSQILRLDIFSNIGGPGTLQLLDGLLQKLFVLAILSLVFAAIAYVAGLYVRHRPAPRKSNLELIDARLDDSSSNYKSRPNPKGRPIIRSRKVGDK
jgi:hypothetical protein